MLDLAIIGGGPAGLSAGLYATRGGLKNVVMFEMASVGGQIISSSEMENYPGVAQVMDGVSFMSPWLEQCTRFGLVNKSEQIISLSKQNDGNFLLKSSGGEYIAKSVIVATGSKPRKAGIQGEDEFFGRGISVCATCDGFFYKNKEVVVLGGGDTALEEALYLSQICSKVYLIHRRDEFRAAPSTTQKVKSDPKIELVLNSVVQEIYGDNSGVTGVKVLNKITSETMDLNVPGVFVFVGLDVRTDVLKDSGGNFIVDMDDRGRVIVDLNMKTSLSGLFAAGDIRTQAPKQVICAAGDGATAALSAIEYLRH